jgi:hypothetical protein
MRLAAHVSGIGLLGPGLDGWPQARAILAGESAYETRPTVLPAPSLLPPAERRRSGRVVKLVLAIAQEATTSAGVEALQLPSVFASSGADGYNCHELCESLTATVPEVSPTRFTNSVHNAPAGYWSIATRAERESTVLSAFDASFGAGLLEALAQVALERTPLLLLAYDTEYPEPLRSKRPIPDAFGVALVLTPERSAASLAHIEVALTGAAFEPFAQGGALEQLRSAIPAARSLPLLAALAQRAPCTVLIEYLAPRNLEVRISPCH